jgi:hypothetical protein
VLIWWEDKKEIEEKLDQWNNKTLIVRISGDPDTNLRTKIEKQNV